MKRLKTGTPVVEDRSQKEIYLRSGNSPETQFQSELPKPGIAESATGRPHSSAPGVGIVGVPVVPGSGL